MNYFKKKDVDYLLKSKCCNILRTKSSSDKDINSYLIERLVKMFSKNKISKSDILIINTLIKSLDLISLNNFFIRYCSLNGVNDRIIDIFINKDIHFNDYNKINFIYRLMSFCDNTKDVDLIYEIYYSKDANKELKDEIKRCYAMLIGEKTHLFKYELEKQNQIFSNYELQNILLSSKNYTLMYEALEYKIFDREKIINRLFYLGKKNNYAWCYFILSALNYAPDLINKIGVDEFKNYIKNKKIDDVVGGKIFKNTCYLDAENKFSNDKVLAQNINI